MNHLLFFGGIGMQELLVVLLLVLLLYGGKKVPEMMRGLGQGVKAFKDGMKDVSPDLSQGGEKTQVSKPTSEPNTSSTGEGKGEA